MALRSLYSKTAQEIALGLAFAVIVSILLLVLTGYLPPRGLATGTAYTNSKTFGRGFWRGGLEFHQVGSTRVFTISTDSNGRYAETLPPGTYRVVRDLAQSGDCLVADSTRECVVQEFTLRAAEHLQEDLTFTQFDQ
jgi:hypothetical protein